jgi:hypothetical protein
MIKLPFNIMDYKKSLHNMIKSKGRIRSAGTAKFH